MVLANDHRDVRGKPREEDGLLASGVAATDDEDVLTGVKHAVTGGAIRDSPAAEQVLALESGLPRRGAGGIDERLGLIGALVAHKGETRLLLIKRDGADGVKGELGAEVLGMVLELGSELRPADALDAWIVVYLVGGRDLAAKGSLLDRERIDAGPRGVDCSRKASRAPSKDDEVMCRWVCHEYLSIC